MNIASQAKLYYLYMMSDGDVSDNERKLFTSICRELGVLAEEKNSIIKECNEIQREFGLSCVEILRENAQGDYPYGLMHLDLRENTWERDKASIMWNLINLGYADTYYTNNEKEVVNYLRDYWQIKNSLWREMIDVAETIWALEKHKKWVVDTLPDSEEKQARLKQIEKDIKYTQQSIRTTISEIEI